MNDCYDPCNHLMFVQQLDKALVESGLFALIETQNTPYEIYLNKAIAQAVGLPRDYWVDKKLVTFVEESDGKVYLNVSEELEYLTQGRYKVFRNVM